MKKISTDKYLQHLSESWTQSQISKKDIQKHSRKFKKNIHKILIKIISYKQQRRNLCFDSYEKSN